MCILDHIPHRGVLALRTCHGMCSNPVYLSNYYTGIYLFTTHTCSLLHGCLPADYTHM